MQPQQFGEHLLLEATAGVEVGLHLLRRFPHQAWHQRREVVVGAHGTLLGRVPAEEDRLLHVVHGATLPLPPGYCPPLRFR